MFSGSNVPFERLVSAVEKSLIIGMQIALFRQPRRHLDQVDPIAGTHSAAEGVQGLEHEDNNGTYEKGICIHHRLHVVARAHVYGAEPSARS